MDINRIFDDPDIAQSGEAEEKLLMDQLVGETVVDAEYDSGVYEFYFSSGIVLTFTDRGAVWGRIKTN